MLGNEIRLEGFVLRPGGQLMRQKTLVVLHALMELWLVLGVMTTVFDEIDTRLLFRSRLPPILEVYSSS